MISLSVLTLTKFFKVWPTNADRNVFRSVMRAESAEVVKLLLKETDEAIELQAAGAYDLKTSIAAPGFVRASGSTSRK